MATSARDVIQAASAIATGMARGNTADTLGAPVDMINTAITPLTSRLGIATETPFGGSAHMRHLFGMGEDKNAAETAGSMISIGGAVKAMIVGAARLGKIGKADIEKAQELFTKHPEVKPASVYNATGVYKGEDDKLRSVISDNAAKTKNLPGSGEKAKLGDVLDHPQLFELYPELKDIDVVGASIGGKEGSFTASRGKGDPGTIKISGVGQKFIDSMRLDDGTQATESDIRSVLLHETQHAIQSIEKWIPGGSPKQFLPKDVDKQAKAVQEAVKRGRESTDPATKAAAERFKDRFNAKLKDAHVQYENIPGEQEARFTQDTRDLNTDSLANGSKNMLKQGQTPQNWDTQPLPSAIATGTAVPPVQEQASSILSRISDIITQPK
jgi:hypothetical protein